MPPFNPQSGPEFSSPDEISIGAVPATSRWLFGRGPFATLFEHSLGHIVLLVVLAAVFVVTNRVSGFIDLPDIAGLGPCTVNLYRALLTLPVIERALLGVFGIILLLFIIGTIITLAVQGIVDLWRRWTGP